MPKDLTRNILLEVAKEHAEREAKTVADKIKRINDEYAYEDTHPHGKRDPSLVSCGQDNGYDELSYIYKQKLLPHVQLKTITRDEAIAALSACCAELPNPRKREEYYALLSDKLGIDID